MATITNVVAAMVDMAGEDMDIGDE